MNKKTVLVLLMAMMLVLLVTAVVAAAPPDRNTVFWFWGEEAGTSQLVRSDSGIHGNFRSSLGNEVGSANGLAVTLSLVIFNVPSECAIYPEPCTDVDIVNPDVKPDVLFGAGNVVGASEKATLGFSRNAGDNSGSIADLIGLPTDGGEPFGLIYPKTAEVHYVLRIHGPKDPAAMPAQISGYPGGCVYNAPYGYDFPANSLDLHLGAGDCQDVQFAVNSP